MVVKGYEDNLGAPLRAVREDVEREWGARLVAEEAKRKEADAWAAELARALEKEKKVRMSVSPAGPTHPFFVLFASRFNFALLGLTKYFILPAVARMYRHGSSWRTNAACSRRS